MTHAEQTYIIQYTFTPATNFLKSSTYFQKVVRYVKVTIKKFSIGLRLNNI